MSAIVGALLIAALCDAARCALGPDAGRGSTAGGASTSMPELFAAIARTWTASPRDPRSLYLRGPAPSTVNPSTMAGYSGTPLAKKLGIKEGHVVVLFSAPDGFERTIDGLPARVRFARAGRGTADVVLLFTKSRADFEKRFEKAALAMTPSSGLWVAWPKKASGIATDMTERVVRDIALPTGMVDNKVCAIDDVWSALRLVHRLENRPKLEAGTAPRAPRARNGSSGISRRAR